MARTQPVDTNQVSFARNSMALPFEPERLIELFQYIVRGLMFYHWGVRLTREHSLEVMLIASDKPNIFDSLMQRSAKDRVSGDRGTALSLSRASGDRQRRNQRLGASLSMAV